MTRPWSDELAGKTIKEQVKTIDRLTAEVVRLREWERHTVAEGMQDPSRYWEARWRDEAADKEKLRMGLAGLVATLDREQRPGGGSLVPESVRALLK